MVSSSKILSKIDLAQKIRSKGRKRVKEFEKIEKQQSWVWAGRLGTGGLPGCARAWLRVTWHVCARTVGFSVRPGTGGTRSHAQATLGDTGTRVEARRGVRATHGMMTAARKATAGLSTSLQALARARATAAHRMWRPRLACWAPANSAGCSLGLPAFTLLDREDGNGDDLDNGVTGICFLWTEAGTMWTEDRVKGGGRTRGYSGLAAGE
ncbi:dicer-like 4 [Striga asiatica]|uniref:Dicer-like 4 n=1 Tax=Striga asiatica TaxID=4170 RepID=A0A5A7Q5T4_STRAF|nr:dicer-like 4 [Striga asiatica]